MRFRSGVPEEGQGVKCPRHLACPFSEERAGAARVLKGAASAEAKMQEAIKMVGGNFSSTIGGGSLGGTAWIAVKPLGFAAIEAACFSPPPPSSHAALHLVEAGLTPYGGG